MPYDDHFYCVKCDRHARDCWCWESCRWSYEDETPENLRCPGGTGHEGG